MIVDDQKAGADWPVSQKGLILPPGPPMLGEKEGAAMTEKESREIIQELNRDEKISLYGLILALRQNRAPAAPRPVTEPSSS